MRKINANMVGIDQGDAVLFSDFEDDGEMWSGQGPRATSRRVQFSQAFITPPSVHLSFSMWDASNLTNARMDVQTDAIDTKGFTITFRTWSDSRVARIRVAWMAIGEAHSDEMWQL